MYLMRDRDTDAEVARYETSNEVRDHIERFPNDYAERLADETEGNAK